MALPKPANGTQRVRPGRRESLRQVLDLQRATHEVALLVTQDARACVDAVGVMCIVALGCDRGQPPREQGQKKQPRSTNPIPFSLRVTNKNEAEAQYDLGEQYAKGDGVLPNQEKATACYRKAAEQGLAKAQAALGHCYAIGEGVAQDFDQAVMWSRKAAEQGDPRGQNNLGGSFATGQGVQQDYAEAVKWFRKAAEQGSARAQVNLGACYQQGHGVAQDYAEAANWYHRAAEQGEARAQHNLGVSYEQGQGVPQDYTEAVEWYRKAAQQGYPPAQHNLSLCYVNGEGVRRDMAEAARWMLKAGNQGLAEAQWNLGVFYGKGEGVPKNDVEAYKWLCLAAAQGNNRAVQARDLMSQRMARAEIIEGQRLASAFAVRKEHAGAGSDRISPKPEIGEGKMSAGTGFFVTDDGYLVTCEHVVRGATSFYVKTSGSSISAKLIKKDRAIDVALLKVNGAFRALPLKPESGIKLGDAVFTIGFPNPVVQGVEPKLTRGEISSMAGIRDNPRYFQISVPVQPGNSGGALVDEFGNVVGVVTARLDDVATYEISGALPQNVNYAVKGRLVRDFLNSVPQLSGKLKAPRASRDREAASAAAERAAALVIAQ